MARHRKNFDLRVYFDPTQQLSKRSKPRRREIIARHNVPSLKNKGRYEHNLNEQVSGWSTCVRSQCLLSHQNPFRDRLLLMALVSLFSCLESYSYNSSEWTRASDDEKSSFRSLHESQMILAVTARNLAKRNVNLRLHNSVLERHDIHNIHTYHRLQITGYGFMLEIGSSADTQLLIHILLMTSLTTNWE
jgi:hypothetical protein